MHFALVSSLPQFLCAGVGVSNTYNCSPFGRVWYLCKNDLIQLHYYLLLAGLGFINAALFLLSENLKPGYFIIGVCNIYNVLEFLGITTKVNEVEYI